MIFHLISFFWCWPGMWFEVRHATRPTRSLIYEVRSWRSDSSAGCEVTSASKVMRFQTPLYPGFFLCLCPESQVGTRVCVCVCEREREREREREGEREGERERGGFLCGGDYWPCWAPDKAVFVQHLNPHKHRIPSPLPLLKAWRGVVCIIIKFSAHFTEMLHSQHSQCLIITVSNFQIVTWFFSWILNKTVSSLRSQFPHCIWQRALHWSWSWIRRSCASQDLKVWKETRLILPW